MSSRGLPTPILRVPPPDAALPALTEATRRHLAPVLAELVFPAERWRIVTAAEMYGAGREIRTALAQLTKARYASVDDVAVELVHLHRVYLGGHRAAEGV